MLQIDRPRLLTLLVGRSNRTVHSQVRTVLYVSSNTRQEYSSLRKYDVPGYRILANSHGDATLHSLVSLIVN